MLLFFQVFFIVLSAVCVAGTIPIGAFFGFTWAIILVLGATLFYFLSMLCKNARPDRSEEQSFDQTNENP